MTWTETPPERPGWYWLHDRDAPESVEVVRVGPRQDGTTLALWQAGTEWELAEYLRLSDSPPRWAGPIPEPTEPTA